MFNEYMVVEWVSWLGFPSKAHLQKPGFIHMKFDIKESQEVFTESTLWAGQ